MSKRKWTDKQFIEAVRTSFSYTEVLQKIGLKAAGNNYDTVKRKIAELNLDASHMTGKHGIREKDIDRLNKNSPYLKF